MLTGYSAAFSPDGKTIASVDSQEIRLWETETGEHKARLTGHTSSVSSVAYSPDGNTLATGSGDNKVRLWDPKTGELKHMLTGYSAAFSPDGKTIASVDSEEIHLWDAITGKPKRTLTGHTGSVSSVAYSPDGNIHTCQC